MDVSVLLSNFWIEIKPERLGKKSWIIHTLISSGRFIILFCQSSL